MNSVQMAQQVNSQIALAMWLLAASLMVGFAVAMWVWYLVIKKAIKNGMMESGLLEALDKIATWQPRDESTEKRPDWSK